MRKNNSRLENFFGSCRSIEEFKKLAKLGEGAYGHVYLARDSKTNELVALKRIKMTSENDGMPITALREIQILRQVCSHQNIVDLKEIVVGPKDDQVFVVFEYCPHDLSCLLDRSGPKNEGNEGKDMNPKARFTESQIKNLMLQLLRALQHLHEREIVHRDIKLSNLLYTNKGELKLADFGLARAQNTFSKSMSPKVVTLWYRSPELLLGLKEYDGYKVDVWAVGCIFGELLLNKPLLPGKDEIGQMHEILRLLGNPQGNVWNYFCTLPKAENLLKGVRRKGNYERRSLAYRMRNAFTTEESREMGIDFLYKMLDFNPRTRISIQQALSHRYFSVSPLPATTMPTYKDNIYHRKFSFDINQ